MSFQGGRSSRIRFKLEDMKKENALKFAKEVSQKAGRRLFDAFRRDEALERGTSKEVKSIYDNVADQIILEMIEEKFPSHSILSEETDLKEGNSPFLWVVDPLDGTGNFTNHNPFFSVSVALYEDKKPVLGVIEAPFLKERFWAVHGGGAWHEDVLRGSVKKAVVSSFSDTSLSYFIYCEGGEKDKRRLSSIYKHVYRKTKEVRKVGSAALELAWVGVGRAEGYYTTKIRFWDIAAGLIFAREAGAEVENFNGDPYQWKDFFQKENFDLLATNGRVSVNLKDFKNEV